ncbi:MAG: Phosphoglycolate phosphatase [Firmicutes bacterium]|nr:Phosphoglycolate phosphatase [candidate division NPL-UPA2 bacterium]
MNKAAIFDLDGTLWDATTVALPAFRSVLARLKLPAVSDSRLALTLGYPLPEIWRMLLPSDQLHLADEADKLMEETEAALLAAGHGAPFVEVVDTLLLIRQRGFLTFICSNCQPHYLSFTPDRLGLAYLFDARYCAGQFQGLTKVEIVALIKERHAIECGFMVGDRFHDVEAGLANGLTTVGCLFGTGTREELKQAHHLIDSFGELKRLVT